MKKSVNILILFILVNVSCKKSYFIHNPPSSASEVQINTRAGAETLLIGAYSLLDGIGSSTDGDIFGPGGGLWQASESNWIQGDVQSDDAVKGSSAGDEGYITDVEIYNVQPTNQAIDPKWRVLYDGISRSNDVLRAAKAAKDIDEASMKRITGEARFLRGHYHADAKKLWNNVPYISDTLLNTRIPNDKDIYPDIEADFQYAIDNLPETQESVGRANKWAAMAYLAKVYIFQKKFDLAKPLLDNLITNGKTSDGKQYGLEDCFDDNFNADTKNGKESVFALQVSTNDGSSSGDNARWGDVLNAPQFGPFCCGFLQPTHNLVNAYKTDPATGLPLLDNFNDQDLKNDEGIKSNEPFTPPTETVDPRLDFTVGRRGIPFLGWGNFAGYDWIVSQSFSGPFSNRKYLMRKSQSGTISSQTGPAWIVPANYPFIRFADVLLWRAEVAVEESDLPTALDYINRVRSRAKNGCVVKMDDGTPAANYKVERYVSFPSQDYARKALQFERRLEFALEGQRFYDLVRWGIADQVLNAYVAKEKFHRTYLNGASFTKGKNEYLPIPQEQITNSSINGQATLKQNPGYN